jgi:GTP cyclohydrolase I
MRVDNAVIRQAIHDILVAVGEDPTREGLSSTPDRVAELFGELYSGVGVNPVSIIRNANSVISDASERGELVALRGIAFHSLCEHHLLPFEGVASVVYQPAQGIVGLGTLATLVEVTAARPQLQERLGEMVAQALMESGVAAGALVLISATHGCVRFRGPKQALTTVTVAAEGTLVSGTGRHEALLLVGGDEGA